MVLHGKFFQILGFLEKGQVFQDKNGQGQKGRNLQKTDW